MHMCCHYHSESVRVGSNSPHRVSRGRSNDGGCCRADGHGRRMVSVRGGRVHAQHRVASKERAEVRRVVCGERRVLEQSMARGG